MTEKVYLHIQVFSLVLVFLLLFPVLNGVQLQDEVLLPYVVLDIFTGTCTNETYLSQWTFPFDSSKCSTKPFLHSGKYYFNSSTGLVTFDTSICSGNNESQVFGVGECTRIHSNYFVNVSIIHSPSFAINESNLWGWLVINFFLDSNCQTLSSSFDYTNGKASFQAYRVQKSYALAGCLNDGYFLNTKYFHKGSYYGVQTLPVSQLGKCLDQNSPILDIWNRGGSTRYRCITDEEAKQEFIDPFLNYKSEAEFIIEQNSYDGENCSNPYFVKVKPTDNCDNGKITKADSNIFYEGHFDYYDDNCATPLDKIYIDYVDGKVSKCISRDTVDQQNQLPIYRKEILYYDPYFPKMIGLFVSDIQCGEDISQVYKRPYDYRVTYYDESFCFPYSATESARMRCENGRMKLLKFYQTFDCQGAFVMEDGISSICNPYGSKSSRIYTCFPRRCGQYSELEREVCNGRGHCESKDLCHCEYGYVGSLCEGYKCYGIDFDSEEVCSGQGKCVSHDRCHCSSGYSGEKCEENAAITLGIIFISVFSPVTLLVLCIIVSFFCFCAFYCSVLLFCCCGGIATAGFISVRQKGKLMKFEQLEDFDYYLQEQLLDKDMSVAKLKINKSLFEVSFEEVKIVRMIGEGGSDAKVFLATWNDHQIAFKCFKTRFVCSSQDRFNTFESEVMLLGSLHHPNIIRFFGASLNPPRVGILMEYCENGEILEFMKAYQKKNGRRYEINEKLRMCREIVSAVTYIHTRSIIHRDIKPENVLIDGMEACKLMDFGISRVVTQGGDVMKTKRVGTSLYMAPEVLTGEYDEKVDSFSFGLLLWVMFTENDEPYGMLGKMGTVEFRVANNPNFRPELGLVRKVFDQEEDGALGKYQWLENVMKKCWEADPVDRYSFKELGVIFNEERIKENVRERKGVRKSISEVFKKENLDIGQVATGEWPEECVWIFEKMKNEIMLLRKRGV